MPAVNIPNLGTVNFPDTMTQEEIINVIKTKILPTIGKQQEAAQPEQAAEKPQVEAPAVAAFNPLIYACVSFQSWTL
jgi:hypothetical protein